MTRVTALGFLLWIPEFFVTKVPNPSTSSKGSKILA